MTVLSWTPVAGATSYRVYRGTNVNGEGTTPIATGVTGATFTDTGLTNDRPYYYVVTAVKGTFEGSASLEVKVARPPTISPMDSSAGVSIQRLSMPSGSGDVLSLNGLNVENVRLSGKPCN